MSDRESQFFHSGYKNKMSFKEKDLKQTYFLQSQHNRFTRIKDADWGASAKSKDVEVDTAAVTATNWKAALGEEFVSGGRKVTSPSHGLDHESIASTIEHNKNKDNDDVIKLEN